MKLNWSGGRTILALLCAIALVAAAACGGGDDDDATTDDAQATSTAARSADAATATTADDEPTATEAEEDEPTATSTTRAVPTATEADEPTATSTTPRSTATSSAESTTPAVGDIPDFETLDPEELPNFSLRMEFSATNLSDVPESTVIMQMEQSEVDNYHFNMEADGEVIELWTIGGQSWMSVDGEVIESPTGPLFSPGDLLTQMPVLPESMNAENEGTEEVNGRDTTRWVIDGSDYIQYMNDQEGVPTEMTNGQGEVTVWIDNDLNIMIKGDGDVTWTNADGTDGSLTYTYEIYDIGSTPTVEAPQ